MVLLRVSYYFQPLFKVTGRMCLQLAGLPLWSTHWQLPVNKADPGPRVYSVETTGEQAGMKAEKSTPIFIFQRVNTGKDIATYFSTPTNWFLGHLQGGKNMGLPTAAFTPSFWEEQDSEATPEGQLFAGKLKTRHKCSPRIPTARAVVGVCLSSIPGGWQIGFRMDQAERGTREWQQHSGAKCQCGH